MGKIILFHGTPDKVVTPTYGYGQDQHDYGRGFYLTEKFELAKEWAVCRPNDKNGWVHQYELNLDELKILDFQEKNILSWLAELMKHRDVAARINMKKLIDSDANKVTDVFSTLFER